MRHAIEASSSLIGDSAYTDETNGAHISDMILIRYLVVYSDEFKLLVN